MQNNSTSINNWQKHPFCINYQVYIHAWPVMHNEQRHRIISALNTLGTLEHNAMCGVTTLNANWGFLIIPPVGFPEIKICFRAEINDITVAEVLDYIGKQLSKYISN